MTGNRPAGSATPTKRCQESRMTFAYLSCAFIRFRSFDSSAYQYDSMSKVGPLVRFVIRWLVESSHQHSFINFQTVHNISKSTGNTMIILLLTKDPKTRK